MPSSPLTECVINLLTPFFMTANADPALASAAAREAVTAYKATTAEQLVSITQLLACALTALDNLRLSLPDDVSLSMKLKLRGNANSLNRSSQQAATALESQRQLQPHDPTQPLKDLETAEFLIKQQQPQTPNPNQASPNLASNPAGTADLAWAEAMTNVAREFKAELPNLPPAQRNAHLIRIGALAEIAKQLANGTAPPMKARLLNSTTLLTPNHPPSHSG